jgi:transcriptional regulator with XRE-family HTH domain
MSVLGKRIKEIREKLNYTQKRFADALKISNVQLSRYESGDRKPEPEMIANIAELLDVSSDYLLGITDNPTPNKKDEEISSAYYDYDNITEEEKDYLDLQLEIFRKMKEDRKKKRNEP